jgi:predicted permease
MRWRRELSRLRALFRRLKLADDLKAEIRAHIAMEEQENLEAGIPPEEAHYAALRRFGNVTLAQERSRDMWVWNSIETLFQDLRYGLRQLRRSPGFAAVAVITLGLGIGANTAIFSLIDTVMLRAMPVRDPSQLVVFRWKARQTPRFHGYGSFGDCPDSGGPGLSGCSFPASVFDAMRSGVRLFSSITAFAGPANLELSGNGPPSLASGEVVSGDYFSILGVNAAIGRTLGPGDDSPAASPVIVLSYAYWQSEFGGQRSVLGRRIDLNNVPFTIVGVASPSFTHLSPGRTQDFWLSIAMAPRLGMPWGIHIANWWLLVMLGRLKPGASLNQAQAASSLVFRNEMLHGAKPLSKPQDDPAITLVPAQKGLTGWRFMFSTPLYVLMAAVGLILLIACANVAGLLLARATTRYKEMAVRLAMGAARARILRQLLTESVMLSIAGAALGIAFAYWGVHIIMGLILRSMPVPLSFTVAPDWRILAFTISTALFTGILFGLAPALRSTQVDLTPALKENTTTAARGGRRMGRGFHLGNTLVIAQVGLSVIVLIGAGLVVRTLRNLRAINPGFDTRNLLLFGIDPTLSGYKDAQIQSLYQNLQTRLAALPGVISASYSSFALLTGNRLAADVHIEGQPEKKAVPVDQLAVGPGFLKAMRIPLLEGRKFTSEDFEMAAEASAASKAAEQAGGAATVQPGANASASVLPAIPVLVNRAFVRRYFPGQNPLGKRITQVDEDETGATPASKNPKSPGWQIVGVVGDTKYSVLRRAIHPTIYFPLTGGGGGAYFELRTAGNPALLIRAVRNVANQVDSRLPLSDIHTQSQEIDELLLRERLVARIASFFGVLAVLLACMGLYGLLSYEVTRRTREVGIRMALGAQKPDVLRLVVKQGMVLALAGVGVGIAGALGLTRFLFSLLYGVKPADPLTFVVVSMVLSGVALLACYIPARRAAKVDPMVALRYE